MDIDSRMRVDSTLSSRSPSGWTHNLALLSAPWLPGVLKHTSTRLINWGWTPETRGRILASQLHSHNDTYVQDSSLIHLCLDSRAVSFSIYLKDSRFIEHPKPPNNNPSPSPQYWREGEITLKVEAEFCKGGWDVYCAEVYIFLVRVRGRLLLCIWITSNQPLLCNVKFIHVTFCRLKSDLWLNPL